MLEALTNEGEAQTEGIKATFDKLLKDAQTAITEFFGVFGQLQTCIEAETYHRCVIVVTQGCCQNLFHTSSDLESMFSVAGRPAVHQCRAIAACMKPELFRGVTVMTQGCCQLCLQSSIGSKSMLRVPAKLLCVSVGQTQTCKKATQQH